MKIKYIICAVLALIFTACNKNEITELPQPSNTQRLEFKSKDEVLLAIQALDSGKNCEILNSHPNFVSIVKAKAMAKKSGLYKVGSDSLSIQTAAFDTLVPNKSFAALLNPKGEIALNDTIFKITTNGTYKYPRNKETLFNTLYQADSLMMGTLISENFYEIGNGIYRYDTFKKEMLSSEDILTSDDDEQPSNVPNYIFKVSNTTNSQPNFSLFPTFSADHHTFVGKLIQSLFGSSKTYIVKFDNIDRRLSGSFYFYDYGIYAESGVHGWTQRKRWIGWSDTDADELRIGWNKVILEMDVENPKIPKNCSPVISNPFSQVLPGNKKLGTTVNLIMYDVPADLVEKVAKLGITQVYKFLDNYSNKPKVEIDAINIISPTKVYTIIFNDNVVAYNTDDLRHVFCSQFKVLISINALAFPSNVAGWVKALSGTLTLPYPKIKSGEIYTCARYGTEWKGMKIVK